MDNFDDFDQDLIKELGEPPSAAQTYMLHTSYTRVFPVTDKIWSASLGIPPDKWRRGLQKTADASLDLFLAGYLGPGPIRRRDRIKWIRRKRKTYSHLYARANLTEFYGSFVIGDNRDSTVI